jgi:hypothetical protein
MMHRHWHHMLPDVLQCPCLLGGSLHKLVQTQSSPGVDHPSIK